MYSNQTINESKHGNKHLVDKSITLLLPPI